MGNTRSTKVVEDLRNNNTNVLFATSVVREGFDLPDMEKVIRYGVVENAVAKQQAVGRVRDLKAGQTVYLGKATKKNEVNDDVLARMKTTTKLLKKKLDGQDHGLRQKMMREQYDIFLTKEMHIYEAELDRRLAVMAISTKKKEIHDLLITSVCCAMCKDMKLRSLYSVKFNDCQPIVEQTKLQGVNIVTSNENGHPQSKIQCSNLKCREIMGDAIVIRRTALPAAMLDIKKLLFLKDNDAHGHGEMRRKWSDIPGYKHFETI